MKSLRELRESLLTTLSAARLLTHQKSSFDNCHRILPSRFFREYSTFTLASIEELGKCLKQTFQLAVIAWDSGIFSANFQLTRAWVFALGNENIPDDLF